MIGDEVIVRAFFIFGAATYCLIWEYCLDNAEFSVYEEAKCCKKYAGEVVENTCGKLLEFYKKIIQKVVDLSILTTYNRDSS